MAQMNMIEAIRSGLDVLMDKDPNVVVLGEDVGYFGGVFRCTDGLQRKYGEHRVIDAPIAEGGIIGASIGMGLNGLRPVAEIQFADYIYPGFDQVVSELARIRYRSGGEFFSPVTIRTPCGGGIRGGQTHSQSPEAIFTHISGIKVVMPSNPYDAKGLLISSIESDDPVVFFEPKRIYNGPFDGDPEKPAVPWTSHPKGEVPEGYYTVPLGKAEVVEEGERADDHYLRHAGTRRPGGGRARRRRCRSHRRQHAVAARRRYAGRVGEEDRALHGRARGYAILRLRRRTGDNRAGRVLLQPRGADRTRCRLGYALPARVRVAVLPGQEARGRRYPPGDGGGMSEYIFKLPDLGEGTVESEIGEWNVKVGDKVEEDAVTRHDDDRQGRGRAQFTGVRVRSSNWPANPAT